ncbi:D-hexose-6-phosphate mutarotase [Pseudoxanthomonas beigongshangi]|uniref:D-hexose-6-phosphate mutarotase n=1 Tax=Pseudoxanthomonas beigongshangi TaxID=2782537 RepID=UPI00193C1B4C|nr:D-hexose-6-phosphate mutarotase [Pseudoxanthomonas beigongshangi]
MTSTPASIHLGDFNGIPAWRIDTSAVRAAVSVQGGQLLAWQPAGFDEVLWCSPTTRRPPQAIRGGVPVCWPYFGRDGQPADAPQHGHARISAWQFVDAVEEDDAVVLDLALPPDPRTPLRLRQRLRIGAVLEQTLITTHDGDADIAFTQALHSYFAVGDVRQVSVSGVDGLRYADKFDGNEHAQAGDWRLDEPRDPGRSDRIYADAGARFTLTDPVGRRRIALETRGSRSLVIWNPGEAGTAAIADLPAQGWREFLCVETANAGADVVRLAPGAEHRLGQRLSVSPL